VESAVCANFLPVARATSPFVTLCPVKVVFVLRDFNEIKNKLAENITIENTIFVFFKPKIYLACFVSHFESFCSPLLTFLFIALNFVCPHFKKLLEIKIILKSTRSCIDRSSPISIFILKLFSIRRHIYKISQCFANFTD
jgi:hypothetical protein